VSRSAVTGFSTISAIFPATKSTALALASGLIARSLNAPPTAKPPRAHRSSKMRRRCSASTSRAEIGLGSDVRKPPCDIRSSRRFSSRRAFQSAMAAMSRGRLWAGTLKLGVRWKMVRRRAWSAMTGIDWMAEEPVPITPTRWPVKSTPSRGQRPVW
jgi:hypothetical protein